MYKIGFLTKTKSAFSLAANGAYEETIDISEITSKNGQIISGAVFPVEYAGWILSNVSISSSGVVKYGVHNTYSSALTISLTIRIAYVYK